MGNQKTLLVVGAGASAEANLPVGSELKSRIAKLLNIQGSFPEKLKSGDPLILDAIVEHVKSEGGYYNAIDLYLQAGRRICDAMPQVHSIDNFLHLHNGNKEIELCGKLGIVRSILGAERSSLLSQNRDKKSIKPDHVKLEYTWYNSFWKLLTTGYSKKDLPARFSCISLIVFNYDRCIEHYLYHSLQNVYGMTDSEAAELVNGIEIYHPYGVVGALPWQQKGESIIFGQQPEARHLLSIAKQIKTFTEGTDPSSSEIIKIRDSVFAANVIIYLGFAFHDLNMDLIRPYQTNIRAAGVKHYATAYGISNSNIAHIEAEIRKLVNAGHKEVIIRNNLECAALIDDYSRSLFL